MKFQIKIIFLSSILLLTSIITYSQNKSDEVLAIIVDSKITASEFKLRFELSPYISARYDAQMLDSLKMDFLYSLIAEKLLAQQALEQGLDTLSAFKFYFKPIEDILLRDLLFKEKIEKSVSITEEELLIGIKKYSYNLILNSVIFKDSISAIAFYNSANNSNFDSLTKVDQNIQETSVVNISFNSLKDKVLEEKLFGLNLNDISFPALTEAGWVLFKLINKEFTRLDISNQETVNSVKQLLRNKKIKEIYSSYLRQLLSGYNINIDNDAFERLSAIITNQFSVKDKAFSDMPAGSKVYLSELDFEEILTALGDNKYEKLFEIEGRTYTIFQFLSNLAFEEFGTKSQNVNEMRLRVSEKIKSFIQQQILTLQARKEKLHLSELYKKEMLLWQDNYLAHKLKNNFIDSISVDETELRDHYNSLMTDSVGVTLLNVRMITSKNLDDIALILDNVNSGMSFKDIALSFGKTNNFITEQAETGLKPIFMLGEIGRVADKIKLNELYGPINFAGGHTVFQIIEKLESKDSSQVPYEDIKSSIILELKDKKLNSYLTERVLEYSERKNVKTFPQAVKNIQVTTIPMFVHRLMGFGGRISAVPITSPWSTWIEIVKLKQKIIF